MYDGTVIASCLDSRAAYDRVSPFVDEHEFTPMGGYWWKLVADWYSRDDSCTAVDREVLRARGLRQAGEKHRETMQDWFDNLPDSVSPDNTVAELISVKRYAKHNELAASDTSDITRLRELTNDYLGLLEAEDLRKTTWIEAGSWDEVDESLDKRNRIKVLPLSLNKRAGGGAVPGHHIILFGPTEIGKSLFAINMVCGFLRQGKRVLYVSNEDSAIVIKDRIRCNLSGMSPEEARQNKDTSIARARSKGVDNLTCGNMDPGSVEQIEQLIEESDDGFDVVVVDQLRNLHHSSGGKSLGITQRLDQVAQEFRSLLLRRQLIGVSIMQAHAGEHGKPQVWMSYDDVDSSRVGVPAQADLLIAIGADDEMMQQGTRAVSICKNKLGGSRDGFLINVDTARSKCK